MFSLSENFFVMRENGTSKIYELKYTVQDKKFKQRLLKNVFFVTVNGIDLDTD